VNNSSHQARNNKTTTQNYISVNLTGIPQNYDPIFQNAEVQGYAKYVKGTMLVLIFICAAVLIHVALVVANVNVIEKLAQCCRNALKSNNRNARPGKSDRTVASTSMGEIFVQKPQLVVSIESDEIIPADGQNKQ
jgi:hypothetical protein